MKRAKIVMLIAGALTGLFLGGRVAGRRGWRAGVARRLMAPVPALPLDLFRVLVGLLGAAYFWRTYREVDDLSSPDGLLDHNLAFSLFPYTRLSLFQQGLGRRSFRLIYLMSLVGSLLLAAGYRARLMAGLLYTTAVSSYRWNFLTLYVDDSLMHLSLLWLWLLPTGRTLRLDEWRREGRGAWKRWQQVYVPGGTLRALLANLVLVYLVAGLWKWTSPLWRQGLAVYAALKMPISHRPSFWQRRHLPLLIISNYLGLLLEPVFALLYLLPTGHRAKGPLALSYAGFHAGIIAALKIPFANVACMATLVLVFREELMARIRGGAPAKSTVHQATEQGYTTPLALALVTTLYLAMLWELRDPDWRAQQRRARDDIGKQLGTKLHLNEELGHHQNPFYGLLWLGGLAQSYRLFDWIDVRNYYVAYHVRERLADGTVQALDPEVLFPRTLRGVLLQSYAHGIGWLQIAAARVPELQASLLARYARRYCRCRGESGWIEAVVDLRRTTAGNLDLTAGQQRRFLSFRCQNGQAEVGEMWLVGKA